MNENTKHSNQILRSIHRFEVNFYRVILTRFYFGIFSISEKFSWNARNNFYLGQRKITSTDERVVPMRFRDKSLA